MENANHLDGFRSDVRSWIKDNFPASLAGVDLGRHSRWRKRRESQ
jgi:hypothetical protein